MQLIWHFFKSVIDEWHGKGATQFFIWNGLLNQFKMNIWNQKTHYYSNLCRGFPNLDTPQKWVLWMN